MHEKRFFQKLNFIHAHGVLYTENCWCWPSLSLGTLHFCYVVSEVHGKKSLRRFVGLIFLFFTTQIFYLKMMCLKCSNYAVGNQVNWFCTERLINIFFDKFLLVIFYKKYNLCFLTFHLSLCHPCFISILYYITILTILGQM